MKTAEKICFEQVYLTCTIYINYILQRTTNTVNKIHSHQCYRNVLKRGWNGLNSTHSFILLRVTHIQLGKICWKIYFITNWSDLTIFFQNIFQPEKCYCIIGNKIGDAGCQLIYFHMISKTTEMSVRGTGSSNFWLVTGYKFN